MKKPKSNYVFNFFMTLVLFALNQFKKVEHVINKKYESSFDKKWASWWRGFQPEKKQILEGLSLYRDVPFLLVT